MALTVDIVKDDNFDAEKVKMFWTPLMLKFKDRPQFKFRVMDVASNLTNSARFPWYLIPTYQGMLYLEKLETTKDNPLVMFDVDSELSELCYDIRNFK
jgi:hypothetical protein